MHYLINKSRLIRNGASTLLLLSFAGCASKLRVTPSPADAEITLKNNMTQEVFPLGQGKIEFAPKSEYGSTFSITVNKKGFAPRDVTITPSPGSSTDYYITLKPEVAKVDENASAKLEAMINDRLKEFTERLKGLEEALRERIAAAIKQAEDNMRLADEDRKMALLERVRAEYDKKNVEADKKVSVLQNTFDVYKDALFSERYAAGPAGYDRRRIDTSVDYVNRIQQAINDKRFPEAEHLVDKLLERDEYFAKGYALKGTVKYFLNKPNESLNAYERALELDPNDKATQRQLAQLYRSTGRQPASTNPLLDEATDAPATEVIQPRKAPVVKIRDK